MEIFHTEDFYVLLNGESSLWISKKSGGITAKPAWELANGQDPECLGIFFGFIGRIKCPVIEDIILLIKESVFVGELPSGHAVHKIKTISMFNPTSSTFQDIDLKPCSKHRKTAFDSNEQNTNNSTISKTWSSLKTATTTIKSSTHNSVSQQNQVRKEVREREKYQRRIKEEVHRIFTDTDSFYFCPAGGDITNTVQRQYFNHNKNKESDNLDILNLIDDRFFWNKHILQDVIDINSPLAKIWVVPIIQGYIEMKQCKTTFKENENSEIFNVLLISRRSRHRVGTRYKRRGLDEFGHCANYVETEQILQYKSHIVSFVQVRGSIPLFWSQQGYKYRPPPQLHKNFEENHTAFKKHLNEEVEKYGPIVIVNLVERTGKEAVVGDAYTDHVCWLNSENITYVTFDLHHYCRGMKFENITLLIDEIQDEIAKMNYCWIDSHGLIAEQWGTFRVNCIDCLDRTNLVQTAIAKEVMMSQLIKLGLVCLDVPYNFSITQQMWANNGDVISKQYAGTNALKGDITRTGNRRISGLMKDGMNSANRYFRTYCADYYKQMCLNLMQGQLLDSENMLPALVDSVFSPIFQQFVLHIYPFTLSNENFCFINELRVAEFVLLLSRYYLSRFKDTTRQATLDLILGDTTGNTSIQQKSSSEEDDEDEEEEEEEEEEEGEEEEEKDGEEEEENSNLMEEENLITVERIKHVIEDVKKLLIEDPSSVIAAWALINANENNLFDNQCNFDVDTILVLTQESYVVADYNSELDKIIKFQEVPLKNLKLVEIVLWNPPVSPSRSNNSVVNRKSGSPKSLNSPILSLYYTPNNKYESSIHLKHSFKSTNLRFFNNIAVPIKNHEEKVECLKAIAEAVQVTFAVHGLGNLELNIRVLQCGKTSAGLENLKTSDVQFSSLKSVGSKALLNVSQQFSKINKFGQNFKFTKSKFRSANKNIENESNNGKSQEAFLPTAGIVLSNVVIDSALNSKNAPARSLENSSNPEILVEGISCSENYNISDVNKLEKFPSSDNVNTLYTDEDSSCSTANKTLFLNLASSSPEEKTSYSLKFGFANATNALSSPSSPLSKLAKGMQNLSSNLDIRRLRNIERLQENYQVIENTKVKEKWSTSKCKTKLIAL